MQSLAIKLDITKSVVRSQGTFQGKALKRSHVLEETSTSTQFFNKRGENLALVPVDILSTRVNPSKALIIEFYCGIKHDGIDKKLPLKLDTGSDVNSINRKTFQRLFPNVQLRPTTHVLQNFDNTCAHSNGHIYCIPQMEKQCLQSPDRSHEQ